MESVILQTAPKPDPCAGILDGICVLQETVESFLNARQFRNAQLADLLPCGFEFIIGNAETSIPAEKALPEITMKRSDLALKPVNPNNLANFGSAVAQPTFSIEFEIKTAYFKLSEMLTLELGQFLLVIAPYIRQFNLNLAGVICGAVHRNRETTPDYYFSKVTVNASIPLTAWKYPVIDDILRSISINLKMNGGIRTAPVELT